MSAIVNLGKTFAAGSTVVYTAQLVDANSVFLNGASIETLTLSLLDTQTGEIINSLDRVDVLNVGQGTVGPTGLVTISLLPADTLITDMPQAQQVQRSIVLEWTYSQGQAVSTGRHEARFYLVPLAQPPL